MIGHERRSGRRVGLLLLVLIATGGCRAKDDRPNLILIVIDTLRADHLHAYGYSRETSPALDRLADRGILFEQAVTAAPWTLPSVMSILTGRLPSSHRVENDGMRLSGSIPTLAEVLRASGYATSAVVSHLYVSRPFGFDRGFERFDDFGLSRDYRFEAGLEPRAESVTDRARAEVRRLRDRRFFLLVHYFDPHWDYDAPEPYKNRFGGPYEGTITGKYSSFSGFAVPGTTLAPADRQHLLDLYDGEIAYTDSQVGRLLEEIDALGATSPSVVVVVSDHGEEFKEHDSMGHGRTLYDEVLRVPLIIAGPKRGGPRRIRGQVRTVDLFPTLCRLGRAALPRGLQGESLEPILSGGEVATSDAVSETIRFDAYRKSLRGKGKKLIVNLESNRREFYDLAEDPAETRNLWPRRGEEALGFEQSLFGQVEVLAGGWNLRWSSDGTPHRFSGSIQTNGLFAELIPLFPDAGRHRVTRGQRVDFDLEGVTGGGGLALRVEPPDAEVGFALALDGKETFADVRIGGRRWVPPASPIQFAGNLRSEFFERPPFRSGKEVGFFLWRSPGPSSTDASELTEAMRERLKSLGYLR